MKRAVWIIERDHKPLLFNGRPVCLTGGSYVATRRYLNHFPTDDGHYYDAVLYERKRALPSEPTEKERP